MNVLDEVELKNINRYIVLNLYIYMINNKIEGYV